MLKKKVLAEDDLEQHLVELNTKKEGVDYGC